MTFPPASPGFIADWMSNQRWYTNKGVTPTLEEIGRVSWDACDDSVEVITHLYLDLAVGKHALYQVPLTYRTAKLSDVEPIGQVGNRWVYDAPHDIAYARALLSLIENEREDAGDRMHTRGEHSAGLPPILVASVTVLTGEQSNTSIVIRPTDGVPLICKVFRVIHHGENPDVELQSTLATAGFTSVPRSFGSVVAEWTDSGRASGHARGHLVFAQEFLDGAQDGWKVAVSAASEGHDFSPAAYDLGRATADMHATLASTFDTHHMSPADIADVIAQMRGRLAAAIAEVPALVAHE
jgi:maltokinase